MRLLTVYNRLLDCYGPQHWWPGDTPFEIMVGAVLTQNTAWSNVEKAIAQLKAADALDAQRLIDARHETLAGWIRSAGYFNVKATRLKNFCVWYRDHGGFAALQAMPTDALRHALLSVNGVGRETADDMLLYAFERPVFVIDAYTHRIFARLGKPQAGGEYETLRHYFETTLERELAGRDSNGRRRAATVKKRVRHYNEYHALIVQHGKDVCRPKPRCAGCCLRRLCPEGKGKSEA